MDCLQFLQLLPDNYVSSIITDPPYELGFMDKKWDSTGITYNIDLWKESLRILKPGGYLLAFSGTRTYHRMASAIEDAGYEIRDMIEWIYFTGFPKSQSISNMLDKRAGVKGEVIGTKKASQKGLKNSEERTAIGAGSFGQEKEIEITLPATEEAKRWQGWGSALKPSHEPIVMARKPLSEKTIIDNVLKWNVGGLNIDACRIGNETISTHNAPQGTFAGGEWDRGSETIYREHEGRFPANSITLEEDQFFSKYFNITPPELSKKASKKDRNSDWEGNEIHTKIEKIANPNFGSGGFSRPKKDEEERKTKPTKNYHPTVKPLLLMDWLITLVTPPNGIVLDFFAGSGSTLVSCKRLGLDFVGTELQEEYYEIAKKRLGL